MDLSMAPMLVEHPAAELLNGDIKGEKGLPNKEAQLIRGTSQSSSLLAITPRSQYDGNIS